jgi:hypothetical protein
VVACGSGKKYNGFSCAEAVVNQKECRDRGRVESSDHEIPTHNTRVFVIPYSDLAAPVEKISR